MQHIKNSTHHPPSPPHPPPPLQHGGGLNLHVCPRVNIIVRVQWLTSLIKVQQTLHLPTPGSQCVTFKGCSSHLSGELSDESGSAKKYTCTVQNSRKLQSFTKLLRHQVYSNGVLRKIERSQPSTLAEPKTSRVPSI